MTTASILSDFWNDQLVAHERQYVFAVLLGFVGAFSFIRVSARLMRSPRVPWWPGSVVSDGGLHVHHMVFGIVLMVAAGTISFAGFATGALYVICALAFGIGIGLTFDEFALWLHLDDVYWSEEGRSSIDATVLAVAFIGLMVIGVRPFDVQTGGLWTDLGAAIGLLLVAYFVLTCFYKQRLWHGAIGLFIQPLAIYGACRLAKPNSPFAKRFYGERNPEKQRRSEQRFPPDRRTEQVKSKIRDAIGGTPMDEYEQKLARRRQDGE